MKNEKKTTPHPKARRTKNGYKIYDDGEECEGCGKVQKLDPRYPEDPAGYVLECPECYRPGCDDCMPAGRYGRCPECEDRKNKDK